MKVEEFIFDAEGTFRRASGGAARSAELQYARNSTQIEAALLTRLDSVHHDWLAVAHAAYLVDRVTKRPPSWKRHFRIHIPVNRPDVWRAVDGELRGVLNFLTEDVWEFNFHDAPRVGERHEEPFLPGLVGAVDEVALFSGGLDSHVGSVIRLKDASKANVVLVSGWTSAPLRARQREQIDVLRRHFPGRIEHVEIGHGLREAGAKASVENSQRARGFLHVTIGSVVSLLCGVSHLSVYENGIGAINLELRSQNGAQASRPINPLTLERLSSFVAKLAAVARIGHFCGITNHFVHWTKGQMCRRFQEIGVTEAVGWTISCDRPRREKGRDHCGVCTSCVLRRLSLLAGGVADGPQQYSVDVFGEDVIRADQAAEIGLMSEQVRRLQGLQGRSWRDWRQEFPRLDEIALVLKGHLQSPTKALEMLYGTYVSEWDGFRARSRLT